MRRKAKSEVFPTHISTVMLRLHCGACEQISDLMSALNASTQLGMDLFRAPLQSSPTFVLLLDKT